MYKSFPFPTGKIYLSQIILHDPSHRFPGTLNPHSLPGR